MLATETEGVCFISHSGASLTFTMFINLLINLSLTIH